MSLTVSDLGEIFIPDSFVRNPNMMFGRSEELADLIIHFDASPNTVPVLVGPPGIGKSSILAMFAAVLCGDTSPLRRFSIEYLAPAVSDRLAIWIKCRREFESGADLGSSLLDQIGRDLALYSDWHGPRTRGFELRSNLNVKAVRKAWERPVSESAGRTGTDALALHFQYLFDAGIGQVVVILDECEQLPWLDHLLDFTTSFHTERVRFCFAVRDTAAGGLASSKDGDYRWARHVAIGPLTPRVVEEILDNAERNLGDLGTSWRVSDDARAYIVRHSGGEPWYVQMLGSALLLDPTRLSTLVGGVQVPELVRRDAVIGAERRVINTSLAGLHGDRYRMLVWGAPKREELLRTIANFPRSSVPLDFIQFAANRRGIRYRPILQRLTGGSDPTLAETQYGQFRFTEHQFRVYCRLTEGVHGDFSEYVHASIDAWGPV